MRALLQVLKGRRSDVEQEGVGGQQVGFDPGL